MNRTARTIAAIALTAATLAGCTLETPPGIPDVELGDTATLDRDLTPWKITGNDTWRIVSHTGGDVEIGDAHVLEAGGTQQVRR